MAEPIGRGASGDFTLQSPTIPSGAITNIWADNGDSVHISASSVTTITSFGQAPRRGQEKRVIVDGILTLTHSANLNLPTSANIITAAGDSFTVYADTPTQLDILDYTRANGTPLAGPLISGTVIATTSGTSHDFTGIPSATKQILLILSGVSLTTNLQTILIQLGTSGGVEATGYTSTLCTGLGTAIALTTSSAGFIVMAAPDGGDSISGCITLALVDPATNTWAESGTVGKVAPAVSLDTSAGLKSLSATLDRVRLTTVTGGTFDAGKFQILYQ